MIAAMAQKAIHSIVKKEEFNDESKEESSEELESQRPLQRNKSHNYKKEDKISGIMPSP